jgi:hypothetical protein
MESFQSRSIHLALSPESFHGHYLAGFRVPAFVDDGLTAGSDFRFDNVSANLFRQHEVFPPVKCARVANLLMLHVITHRGISTYAVLVGAYLRIREES